MLQHPAHSRWPAHCSEPPEEARSQPGHAARLRRDSRGSRRSCAAQPPRRHVDPARTPRPTRNARATSAGVLSPSDFDDRSSARCAARVGRSGMRGADRACSISGCARRVSRRGPAARRGTAGRSALSSSRVAQPVAQQLAVRAVGVHHVDVDPTRIALVSEPVLDRPHVPELEAVRASLESGDSRLRACANSMPNPARSGPSGAPAGRRSCGSREPRRRWPPPSRVRRCCRARTDRASPHVEARVPVLDGRTCKNARSGSAILPCSLRSMHRPRRCRCIRRRGRSRPLRSAAPADHRSAEVEAPSDGRGRCAPRSSAP